MLLRRRLLEIGMWSSTRSHRISGKPDLVFRRARVVVFCDGDYWHGRNLKQRLARLEAGHNATYWVAKISSNVERDRRVTAALASEGWLVLRYWETDILKNVGTIAHEIAARVIERRPLRRLSRER